MMVHESAPDAGPGYFRTAYLVGGGRRSRDCHPGYALRTRRRRVIEGIGARTSKSHPSLTEQTGGTPGARSTKLGTEILLQQFAVQVNHNTLSTLALAQEVFSEEKYALLTRLAQ